MCHGSTQDMGSEKRDDRNSYSLYPKVSGAWKGTGTFTCVQGSNEWTMGEDHLIPPHGISGRVICGHQKDA